LSAWAVRGAVLDKVAKYLHRDAWALLLQVLDPLIDVVVKLAAECLDPVL
jgi:hypothetical protein